MALVNNNVDDKMDLSLESTLDAVGYTLHLFFENKFDLSKRHLVDNRDKSLYHSVAALYHSVCYALFTMEKDNIEEAMEQSKQTAAMIEARRKKSGFGSSITGLFTKTDYNDYTDEEAHAEMCCSELNFMVMMLTFFSDQSFLSMIRAARRFFSCHSSVKLCNEIMKAKTNWSSDKVKVHFDCGVEVGFGFLNLMFSHLPARVIKLLAFAGFSADRALALSLLKSATYDKSGLFRSKLAGFLVCLYSFYLEQFFGLGEADIPWVQDITDEGLKAYPGGAFDLFWSARLHQLKGETEVAIDFFQRSIGSQSEFKQMHNVCRWDLLWSYAIKCDWKQAADCAKQLQDGCQWSPATNCYQYACFLYMIMEEEDRPDLRPEVDRAMAEVPKLRMRYGGKTIPPEKYAIIMAERYNSGETELVLPALMLFYIWNIYGNSAQRPDLLEPILAKIKAKTKLTTGDDYYSLLLVKGVVLRNMKRPQEAIGCFQEILKNEPEIVRDKYIAPHAAFEVGLSYMDVSQHDDAKAWLEKARDKYKNFLVESLVHLRIHGALNKLKALRASEVSVNRPVTMTSEST